MMRLWGRVPLNDEKLELEPKYTAASGGAAACRRCRLQEG